MMGANKQAGSKALGAAGCVGVLLVVGAGGPYLGGYEVADSIHVVCHKQRHMYSQGPQDQYDK
jgi:hypothetical protein